MGALALRKQYTGIRDVCKKGGKNYRRSADFSSVGPTRPGGADYELLIYEYGGGLRLTLRSTLVMKAMKL